MPHFSAPIPFVLCRLLCWEAASRLWRLWLWMCFSGGCRVVAVVVVTVVVVVDDELAVTYV